MLQDVSDIAFVFFSRSYQELQAEMAKQKLKFNTEFEKVQALVDGYGNATREGQLATLEDLELYLHQ